MSDVEAQDWGLIDYEQAVARQLELVNLVAQKKSLGTIAYCVHPAVVTTGRTTPASDIFSWSGPVVAASRGGRATYHGPNQLVIYPILDLSQDYVGLRSRNVSGYVTLLGEIVVALLAELGVKSELRQGVEIDDEGHRRQLTGVWVTNAQGQLCKIASLGVAVKKWVTYHGIAINLFEDEQAFKGINPCGFKTEQIISFEKLTGEKVSREQVQKIFQTILLAKLFH